MNLLKPIGNAFDYKSGSLILLSTPFAFLIDFIFNGCFLGISVSFLLLMTILLIADFATGIWAAKHDKEKMEESKLSFTFYKAFSYVIFFWILVDIDKMLIGNEGWVYQQGVVTNAVIRNFIFIILILREFISIGENIEKRFGRKPYIFVLANKITEIVEKQLIKRFTDRDENKPKG